MAWRAVLACALCGAVFVAWVTPGAAAKKPVLKDACKLATNGEIKRLMGRSVKERRSTGVEACLWITRRPKYGEIEQGGRNGEQALVELRGHHRTVAEAKQTADLETTEVTCGLGWDPFLPGGDAPWDEGWLSGCGEVVFRIKRIIGVIRTFTNDVPIDSAANQRRTAKLAKKAAKRLRRYRCPRSFCP